MTFHDTTISADTFSMEAARHLMTAIFCEGMRKQGIDACLAPRYHAAVHEAGHAIIAHGMGLQDLSIKLFCKTVAGHQTWGGVTLHPGYRVAVNDSTAASSDIRNMAFTMAGVIAERCLLEDDFRLASSVDEIAWATLIAGSIAWKYGLRTSDDAVTPYEHICGLTEATLIENWRVIERIARKLMNARALGVEKLKACLAECGPPPSWLTSEFDGAAFLLEGGWHEKQRIDCVFRSSHSSMKITASCAGDRLSARRVSKPDTYPSSKVSSGSGADVSFLSLSPAH